MKLRLIPAVCVALFCSQVFATTTPTTQTTTATTTATSATPADQNKLTGEAFLKANKAKPGVTTLADGLQYKIVKAGTGPKPGPNDSVTVNYSGKLINGQEFDNSEKHGGAASFVVGQVIPGWVEALQLMPVGSTWEIYIPENLAYGEQGAPPAIGPNETLIFTVTLIDTKKSG